MAWVRPTIGPDFEKQDLGSQRQVTVDELAAMARKLNCAFHIEVSAASGYGGTAYSIDRPKVPTLIMGGLDAVRGMFERGAEEVMKQYKIFDDHEARCHLPSKSLLKRLVSMHTPPEDASFKKTSSYCSLQ